MIEQIDARGLSCPQPVLITKKALEQIKDGTIRVIVDNKPALENISRFARNAGCEVRTKEEGRYFIIEIIKRS